MERLTVLETMSRLSEEDQVKFLRLLERGEVPTEQDAPTQTTPEAPSVESAQPTDKEPLNPFETPTQPSGEFLDENWEELGRMF